jgi:hypothetical protein
MDALADRAQALAYCEKAVSAGTKKKYKLKINRLVKYCERNFPNCLNDCWTGMTWTHCQNPSPDEVIISFLGSKTFQIKDPT